MSASAPENGTTDDAGDIADDPIRLNVVADLGADPSGTNPEATANALLALGGFDGDISLYWPPGEYALPSRRIEVSGPSSIRIYGTTSDIARDDPDRPDTPLLPTIVAPREYSETLLSITAPSLAVDNLHIDRHAYGAGPQFNFRTTRSGTLRCSDLAVLGRDDSNAPDGSALTIGGGPRSALSIAGLRMPHGAWWSSDRLSPATDTEPAETGRAGLTIDPTTRGQVRITDPVVAQCSGHGLDARCPADVTIQGGTLANSNGAQCLVSESDNTIRGLELAADLDSVSRPSRDRRGTPVEGLSPSAYSRVVGLVIDGPRTGRVDRAGQLGGVDIAMRSDAGVRDDRSDPTSIVGPALRVTGTAGGPTIVESDLTQNVDGVATIATSELVRGAISDGAGVLRLRSTSLHGDARSGVALDSPDRAVSVRDGCIARPGARIDFVVPDGSEPQVDTKRRCPRRTVAQSS